MAVSAMKTSSMGVALLNATAVAVGSVSIDPGIMHTAIRHSGGIPSQGYIGQVIPRLSLTIPMVTALGLIQTSSEIADGLRITAFKIHLIDFDDGVRGNATQLSLTASCGGHAVITGIAPGQGGVLMASVEIMFYSNDGHTTHPWTLADDQTVVTLGSEPDHYLPGHVALGATDGSVIPGVQSWSIQTGLGLVPLVQGGERFPRDVVVQRGAVTASIQSSAPRDALDDIGLSGAVALDSSGGNDIILYARKITNNAIVSATGGSLTAEAGTLALRPIQQGDIDSTSIEAIIHSTDRESFPFAWSASATMPGQS